MSSAINVLLYTLAPRTVGGGGRKVSIGLLKAFNANGCYCAVYSIEPFSEDIKAFWNASGDFFSYNETPLSPDGALAGVHAHIADLVATKGFDAIICDTEYAYRDFAARVLARGSKSGLCSIVVLVHDQVWRDDVGIVRQFARSRESAVAMPYRVYSAYLQDHIRSQRDRLMWDWGLRRKPSDLLRCHQGTRRVLWLLSHLKAVYLFRNIRSQMRSADLVFSLTARSAEETAIAYGLENNRSQVAFGLLHGAVTEELSLSEGRLASCKRVIAFSRISEEKCIEVIIFAYRQVRMQCPSAQLVIMGRSDNNARTESYRKYLHRLLEEDLLTGSIRLIVNPDDSAVEENLNAAKTFVCAQNCDFNLTTYEAMHHGLSVVVPISYDFPDQLKSSKMIYGDNVSIDDFAASILNALDSDARYTASEVEFIRSLTFSRYASVIQQHILRLLERR